MTSFLPKNDFPKASLCLIFGLLFCTLPTLRAQGTLEDYQRSEVLKNKLKDKVYNAPALVNWSKSNQWAWYPIQTPRGKEFIAVNPQTKSRQLAFDHEQLAQKLSEAAKKKIEPYSLPFSTFTYSKDDKEIEFNSEGFVWTYGLTSNSLRKKEPIRSDDRRYWGAGGNEQNEKPVFSPDSTWTAYIKNYNLYVRSEKTKKETQLSYDGSEGDYYSGYVQWSPDSKKVVSNKIRPNQKHLIYFVRSSPEDQLQPKLESREYLKPGDAWREPDWSDPGQRKSPSRGNDEPWRQPPGRLHLVRPYLWGQHSRQ